MLSGSGELAGGDDSGAISILEYRSLRPAAGGRSGQDAPKPEPGGRVRGRGAEINARPFLVRTFRALVQQIAVGYVARGYVYWVRGRIPQSKLGAPETPCESDWKMIAKYGCDGSRNMRYKGKKNGRASVAYLRWNDVFVLLATEGEHAFFEAEGSAVRDIRVTPLALGNYVITYKNGSALVDLKDSLWKKISRVLWELSLIEKAALEKKLSREMKKWPAYKPIQNRWERLLESINARRKRSRLVPIDRAIIPAKRWQQKVFITQEA